MKKAIIFLSAALVALAACNKYEKDVVATPSSSDKVVTFNVSVSNPDESKAVKKGWATGDKIYVFFENIGAKWLVLTYNGSTWDAANGAAEFVAGDFSTLGTKELTAVHTPADVTVAWDSENSKFSFTDNSTNSIKPIYNYYLLEEDKTYTVDDITVNVTLAMGKPANFVWFYVDGISANVDQFYLKENNLTPTAPASVALAGGVTEATKTTGYPIAGVALSTGGIYAGKVGSQSTYAFQLVKVYSAATMIATRTYTKAGTKTFAAGYQYNLGSYTSMTENKWVDLGFESNNVLWATGYLTDDGSVSGGGSIVEINELGGYYAFCSTNGQEWDGVAFDPAFTEENAPYYHAADAEHGGKSYYTKYYDSTRTYDWPIAAEDDAATVQLGLGWRIPSYDEVRNLVTYQSSGTVVFPNPSAPAYPTTYHGTYVNGPNGLKMFCMNTYDAVGTGRGGTNKARIMTNTFDWQHQTRCKIFLLGSGMSNSGREIGIKIIPVRPID